MGPAALVFIIGVAIGVPIAFAMGFAGTGHILLSGSPPITAIPTVLFGGMDSFTLLAIPFFIMAGDLMARSGMLGVMVEFANALVGPVRGGLAHVNVGSSMLFGGVTGVSLADTAAIGRALVPDMIRNGYSPGFAAAITAASSVMGAVIPPSVGMLIIAALFGGGVSVAKLFLAGVTPGLLIGLSMMAIVALMAGPRGLPRGHGHWSAAQILQTGRAALLGLVVPVGVIGGIVGGVFTATEAGVMAVAYALVIGVFVLRTLGPREIAASLLLSAKTSGMIYLMLAVAKLFAWLLVLNLVPQSVSAAIGPLISSPTVFLLFVFAVFVLAGFMIEGVASMIIFVPVLAPLATQYGVEPHHMALVIVMAVQVSLLTPPVALGLFIVLPFAGCTMRAAAIEVIPFAGAILAVILLVIILPGTAMWLPDLFGF